MKKLRLLASLAFLILIISGCANVLDNLTTTTSPKVNQNFQSIDYSSIKQFQI